MFLRLGRISAPDRNDKISTPSSRLRADMNEIEGCEGCKLSEDLRLCAKMHVGEARRLLSEGKIEDADSHLQSLETRLKE